MAEVTGMRNNALPYPVYGVAFYITFPLLDADGDPISPSSPDSERSLNGDTFADCTNEATEIATSSGICYLLLTAAEMTADIVTVQIKSTGAKTTVMTLYPRKLVVVRTGTCQGANDTGDIQLDASASAVDDYYNGCLCVAVIDSTTEARIINDYVGSTKVGEVSPAWNTAAPDNNDTFTIYAVPENSGVGMSDNVAFLGTASATAHTAGYPVVTIKDGTGTGEIDTNAGAIVSVTTTGTATNVTTVNGLAANVITATSLNADAATEIAAAVWLEDIDGDSAEDVLLRVDSNSTNTLATIGVDGAGLTEAGGTGDQLTAIWATAMSDLAAVPGATASALDALNWLFELARNKLTQTATTGTIFKDDASTSLATTTVSDDLTTFTRGEWA